MTGNAVLRHVGVVRITERQAPQCEHWLAKPVAHVVVIACSVDGWVGLGIVRIRLRRVQEWAANPAHVVIIACLVDGWVHFSADR